MIEIPADLLSFKCKYTVQHFTKVSTIHVIKLEEKNKNRIKWKKNKNVDWNEIE